jgi:hypothetical protein
MIALRKYSGGDFNERKRKMGQYFIPANISKQESFYGYRGFMKIMEHGYSKNPLVLAVLSKLENEWFGDRIVWAGDYEDACPYEIHTIYGDTKDEDGNPVILR